MMLRGVTSTKKAIIPFSNSMHTSTLMPFLSSFTQAELQEFEKNCPPYRKRIFTPGVTLSAFLSQVVGIGSSCKQAVTEVLTHQVSNNLPICSMQTSSYSRARGKIPTQAILELTKGISNGMENQVPAQWRTKNRKVLLLDGSTLPLPDTKENREKFPPRKDQAKDMGTPIARVSVLTSLETGSVIDFEMSGWVGKGKGEFYLGRKLLENLSGQEILIGDAFYFSYFFFSLVREKNAEFVTRIKGNRKFIIKGEKRLAKGDRLILISKPRIPHTGWLDEATYEKVPNETILRETTVTLQKPGFRDKHITLISTLIHEKEFSAEDIADLYSQRWNIELDFRAIKQTMGLHALKCKKPSMALKEAWIHLLAYNLIRRTIQEAAINSGQKPRSISMNGAFLAFSSFKKPLSHPDMNLRRLIYHKMLACIASQQVGKRPGRLEPRARKKMAYYNDYPKLRISRNKWRLLTILPHLDLVLSSAAQEGIQKLQKRMPACNYNKYSVLC